MTNQSISYPSQPSLDSITKSQTSSQLQTQTLKLSQHPSLLQIAHKQLLTYSDISQTDFIILPTPSLPKPIDTPNLNPNHNTINTNIIHDYKTQVPIGPNHQISIPKIIPIDEYLDKYRTKITNIQKIKIHDPELNQLFYQQHHQLVRSLFGNQRSYEDINQLRIAFINKSTFNNFEKYLNDQLVNDFWEEYFINKDKQINKNQNQRKKRKIG